MKITLDTEKKEITLGESADLEAFVNAIKKLLPDGAWKEYKLITNTTVSYWQNPIYVPYHGIRPYWDYGPTWCSTTSGDLSNVTGTTATLTTNGFNTETTMCFDLKED